MAETTPKTRAGTGREARWQRWLLVVSLGFNLLVLGLVAGAMIHGGPPGNRAPRFDLTVGPLTRALEDDDRRAIRRELEDQRPYDRDDRSGMRRDAQALLQVLTAEEFDGAAFRDLLDRQRARLQLAQDAGVDQLILRIEAMTPDARKDYAGRLGQELRHMVMGRDQGRD